ncbi:MAG: hypothetical protein HZA15_06070, partial [Nitrospirae bacterium]|nr:hypothetical protein [Nitrospirota bacterium]
MTASISQLNMKFHRVPGILSMGVQCISPLWCISACSPAAQHSTSWLDWIPYIGAVAAIVLGRFLLKLISQKPPPYPMFNYWEQNELYGKSQLNKERLAQLEFFRRKDPTFEGDEFLKWVNSEIAEAIHNVYKVDPDIQHEILNEWVAMPPEEKEKVQKYNGLWGMPVERLRPFCTDEMIRQLEKEMGSECGRITGKVITGSGAVSGPSVRHSSYVG